MKLVYAIYVLISVLAGALCGLFQIVFWKALVIGACLGVLFFIFERASSRL